MDTHAQTDPSVETPEVNRKLAKIVAQAWLDPNYRRELVADPKQSFVKAGVPLPADVALTVLEDSPVHRHMVLADKKLPPRNQVTALSAAPDYYSVYAYVYNRAQQDPEFKAKFTQNPTGTVRELGALLPEGATVSVHFDTYGNRYFVLPMTPRARMTIEMNEANVTVLDATAVNVNINVNANVNVNADANVNAAAVATVVVAIAVLI